MKNNIIIRLPFYHTEEDLLKKINEKGFSLNKYFIVKKSLDARNKNKIEYEYVISSTNPYTPTKIVPVKNPSKKIPIIVGAGPAGVFAAYWLLIHNINSIIIEQGDIFNQRVHKITDFIKKGILDEKTNICFGAGGAGAFSDGKLMTRIKSDYIHFFKEVLIKFGAPSNIRYLSKPHLGTNLIRKVFQNILNFLEKNGVKVFFNTELIDFKFTSLNNLKKIRKVITSNGDFITDEVFLCSGHSARNIYKLLAKNNCHLSFKPFAVGLRVEHSADYIDNIQYGKFKGHPMLEHATYNLTHTWKNKNLNRAIFSFCMCPGGVILNSSSENGCVVSNGMSNTGRFGKFSNSAIVVNVLDHDVKGSNFFKGLDFQIDLETKAALSVNEKESSYYMPAIKMIDFLNKKSPKNLSNTSCLTPIKPYPLYNILPGFINDHLIKGINIFNKKMKGFINKDALLIGVESRTSSPIRINRDKVTFQSLNIEGLYPVGEGSGYSGGITSSAIDGIKAANAYINRLIG